MKNFTKLATVFGGALLASGCGQTSSFVEGTADAVAVGNSAIQFQGDINQKSDKLVGYFTGCQHAPEQTGWKILFGSGKLVDKDGNESTLKVTKGDSGCQLWATGMEVALTRNGVLVDADGKALAMGGTPVIQTFSFYSPNDITSPTPIQVRTNSPTQPFIASNVVLARRMDTSTGKVIDDGASTMVNVGAVNLADGTSNPTTGALDFKLNFALKLISGSAADLAASSALASFIGYQSLNGVGVDNWAAPNYTSSTHDAIIKTDGNNKIIQNDRFFKFQRGTIPGTEVTWGSPGDVIKDGADELNACADPCDDDNNTMTEAVANPDAWQNRSDTRRYEILRQKFDALSAANGVTGVSSSQTIVAVPAANIFPLELNLFDENNRRTVIMMQRRDGNSGVKSYQAILLNLIYTPAQQ